MLTLITGAPGAGKSAALVEMLLKVVGDNRKVYAEGIPDLLIEHQPFNPLTWHEPGQVDDGSCLVVDEAWRHWPAAAAGSRVPACIDAMAVHRHRGLDIYLVCQHPSQLHNNVRRLVARHVHLVDLGLMGRWWYEFPEATDPGKRKSAPIKKRYTLPKKVFANYKSASVHIKPVRSIPPVLIALGLAVICVSIMGYRFYSSYQEKLAPKKPPETSQPGGSIQPGTTAPQPAQAAPVIAPARMWQALEVAPRVEHREPYAGFGVHLGGSFTSPDGNPRAWFTLSVDGATVGTVSDRDMARAGYAVRYLAPCVVVLILGDLERVARCDAPARPVTVAQNAPQVGTLPPPAEPAR